MAGGEARPRATRSPRPAATITHHHGVGRDHARWLTGEIGELGVAALRAVKERVDPAGIMNPGKLLP